MMSKESTFQEQEAGARSQRRQVEICDWHKAHAA